MSRKKISQTNQKKRTNRQGSPIPWRYCVLTLICGLFLITGFFFAAGQHFSSIDYSIKNSKLRRQLDELEADKRRLLLSKEIALSPSEIKKVARKIGFTETANRVDNLPPTVNSVVKPAAEKIKQAISNKIETVKKAAETTVKETVKGNRPQNTEDKPDKTQSSVK